MHFDGLWIAGLVWTDLHLLNTLCLYSAVFDVLKRSIIKKFQIFENILSVMQTVWILRFSIKLFSSIFYVGERLLGVFVCVAGVREFISILENLKDWKLISMHLFAVYFLFFLSFCQTLSVFQFCRLRHLLNLLHRHSRFDQIENESQVVVLTMCGVLCSLICYFLLWY